MKPKLLLLLILLVSYSFCIGQQNTEWNNWKWLMGEWKGEGSGEPGKGSGKFSFNLNLNDKIIIRKSQSEYPATGNKPGIIHEDIMVVYLDRTNSPSKAIYFDNEGHTINYSISYPDKNIVLLSDKIPNIPVFRLTYTSLDPKTINVKFEMSQDGEKFRIYLEGKSVKQN